MATLIEDLGSSYVNEMFNGCLLLRKDKLHSVVRTIGGEIQTQYIDLLGTEVVPIFIGGTLPASELSSFKDLAWPKLGYRNYFTEEYGNIVVFVESMRSPMRGLRPELLQQFAIPALDVAGVDFWGISPTCHSTYQLKNIFRPTWISFSDGMGKLVAGEWAGFALNEDFAISIPTEQVPDDSSFEILFRRKVVGSVSMRGAVSVENKVLKKSALNKLMSSINGG